MKKKLVLKDLLLIAGMAFGTTIVAQPSASAPTPLERTPSKVISIFSDAYTNIAGVNFRPDWGQPTQVETIQIGTDNVLKYSALTYEGTEFTEQNCAAMTHLHIDVWADANATLGLSPINKCAAAGEQAEQAYSMVLTGGQWNSFDIPLTAFDKMSFSCIWQFKVDGGTGQTVYLDNLYFYNSSTVEDTTPPTGFTASAGKATYNSIELLLNATDDSNAINYEVAYGGKTLSTGGVSGVQKSYIVTGLESSTAYTFSITAKDPSGNVAANSPLSVTASTAAAFAVPTVSAPTPTADAAKVISIYSDAYTQATAFIFGQWGGVTVPSIIQIGSDNVMKLENLSFQGLELNNNLPAFDAKDMKKLHIDVWTPNATKFQVTPIGGGENLYTCSPLLLEQWNSYDIPLTSFPNVNLSGIYQFKFVGEGEMPIVYVDNLYLYDDTASSIDQPESTAQLFVEGNTLRFTADTAQSIEILSTTGQTVYRTTEPVTSLSYPLMQGVYLVRTGNAVGKIVVR